MVVEKYIVRTGFCCVYDRFLAASPGKSLVESNGTFSQFREQLSRNREVEKVEKEGDDSLALFKRR
jgi:hypothetical protein